MSTVQEIQHAIQRLPTADLQSLARWMEDFLQRAIPQAGREPLTLRDEAAEWSELSAAGLQGAFGESEPEYPLTLIKTPNPGYAGR